MAAKSAESRRNGVFLTRDEADALRDCYALLRSIARRGKLRQLPPDPVAIENAPVAAGATGTGA